MCTLTKYSAVKKGKEMANKKNKKIIIKGNIAKRKQERNKKKNSMSYGVDNNDQQMLQL